MKSPIAAANHWPHTSICLDNSGDKSSRTCEFEPGLLIDYNVDGRAIGVEITSPSRITLDAINRALVAANQEPVTAADLVPLVAA